MESRKKQARALLRSLFLKLSLRRRIHPQRLPTEENVISSSPTGNPLPQHLDKQELHAQELLTQKSITPASLLGKLLRRRLPNKPLVFTLSIEELPDEVLIMIVHFATDSDGMEPASRHYSLYRSMSLVNRRFSRVAYEALFRTYEHQHNGTAQKFLHTIATSIELGAMVKNISCSAKIKFSLASVHPYERSVIEEALEYMKATATQAPNPSSLTRTVPLASDRWMTEVRVGELMQKLKLLELPAEREWIRWLAAGSDQIELALIMCFSPNLEAINISSNCHDLNFDMYRSIPPTSVPVWLQHLTHAARGLTFGKVHSFNKLRSIRVNMSRIPICVLQTVLGLPSLRVFQLDEFNTSNSFGIAVDGLDFARGISNVEKLILHKCEVYPQEIIPFIGSCKALQEFSFDGVDRLMLSAGRPWLDYISAALQAHQHTLRTLRIEFQTDHIRYWRRGSLSSLHEFNRLESLSCNFSGGLAYGANDPPLMSTFLPTSIKRLEIVVLFETELPRVAMFLRDLLAVADEQFWYLAVVLIRCNDELRSKGAELEDAVRLYPTKRCRVVFGG